MTSCRYAVKNLTARLCGLALLMLSGASASAAVTTIIKLDFGGPGTTADVTYNQATGVLTTLTSAGSVGKALTGIEYSGGLEYLADFDPLSGASIEFSFTAAPSGSFVDPVESSQVFRNGSFTIFAPTNETLLTGTISEALLLSDDPTSALFTAGGEGNVTYTGGQLLPLISPLGAAFTLTMTTFSPPFAITGAGPDGFGGTLQTFRSQATGSFDAEITAVPEPASIGLVAIGLAFVSSRRRKAARVRSRS